MNPLNLRVVPEILVEVDLKGSGIEMKLSDDALIKRSDSLMSARLGDSEAGAVVLDRQTNAYFGLDGVAAFIWEQLDSPLSLSELVTRIVSEYDVASAKATDDARVFIQHLVDKGLVDVAES